MNKLIKISKPNCAPCKIVGNQLDNMDVEYEEYDIVDDPSLIEKFNLSGVPVLILLDENNEEVYRVSGFNPTEITKIVSML